MEGPLTLPKGFSSILIEEPEEDTVKVIHKEVGYGGEKEDRLVAFYHTESKVARPVHGYFPPHPTGKKLGKFFKSVGYEWDAS